MERAERLRIFDLSAIQAVIARNPRRPGAKALAAVLAAWTDPEPTRSDLELDFIALCRRHGLARPVVNAVIAGYEVDFHWPATALVVETDGRDTHATRAAFERDRERDAHLTALGFRVVRFTYRQVLDRPAWVARVLHELLAQPARSISSTR